MLSAPLRSRGLRYKPRRSSLSGARQPRQAAGSMLASDRDCECSHIQIVQQQGPVVVEKIGETIRPSCLGADTVDRRAANSLNVIASEVVLSRTSLADSSASVPALRASVVCGVDPQLSDILSVIRFIAGPRAHDSIRIAPRTVQRFNRSLRARSSFDHEVRVCQKHLSRLPTYGRLKLLPPSRRSSARKQRRGHCGNIGCVAPCPIC